MTRDATQTTPTYAILGATGGIGAALARDLAARGCRLALAGQSDQKLALLRAELGGVGAIIDAREFEQVDGFLSGAVASLGPLDGVANCVGSLLLKPAHLTQADEWDDVIGRNLQTAFAVVRSAAPLMRKTGGSIVLVSSAAGRQGFANHEAIAAAKAGVIGLTLSAAATYATQGIRVNCVAPGLTRTPMTEFLTGNETTMKASMAMHALGRVGEPDEVARAIAWLLDREQGWVTGQAIGVDGGLSSLHSRRRA